MPRNPEGRSLRMRPATPNSRTWRLLAALADSTPAFTPAPAPPASKTWQRLLAALADSTSAFDKDARAPEAPAALPSVAEPQASALRTFAAEFACLPAYDRLMARTWYPVAELSKIHNAAQFIAVRRHELSDEQTDRLASFALLAAERAAVLASAVSRKPSSREDDIFVAIQQTHGALISVQIASSALTGDEFGVLSHHGTRQVERASQELTRVMAILEPRLPSKPHNYVKDLVLERTRTLTGQLRTLLDGNPFLQKALQAALHEARTEIRNRVGKFASDQALATAMIAALTQDLESEDLLDLSGDVCAAADVLITAVTDMTAANLTEVDLSGLRLTGVKWSADTQWPTTWEDSIRARSTEIGPNLYTIIDPPEIDTTTKAGVVV
ncbi:hypothetical protein [Amycolatopsis sp. lyj-112]|uniref:hypothetical protein n=1 Tax=Amycolatopsis sp. lyj-112 TaxID=2789288 RepID=UPI00397DA485